MVRVEVETAGVTTWPTRRVEIAISRTAQHLVKKQKDSSTPFRVFMCVCVRERERRWRSDERDWEKRRQPWTVGGRLEITASLVETMTIVLMAAVFRKLG